MRSEIRENGGFVEVDAEIKDALVEKCQQNCYLRKGGIPWRDDPWFEDFPYEFYRTESMEGLRDYLAHGNWAIRQGALFHDLAFIQQECGGDEWWTLKDCGTAGWLSFESWSFCDVAQDARAFSSAIVSMEMASALQCQKLRYALPENDFAWQSEIIASESSGAALEPSRRFKAEDGLWRMTIREHPEATSFSVAVRDKETGSILYQDAGFDAALDAAIAGCASVGFEYKPGSDESFYHALSAEHCMYLRESARALAVAGNQRGHAINELFGGRT